MYRLASGDNSPLDAVTGGGQQSAPSPVDTLPEDYMPFMPQHQMPQQQNRNYFISPTDMGVAQPDTSTQTLLTNLLKSKESSNNYQAVNPKSSASGAYQYTDSTWNGYGGYSKAALAPAAVQDAKFAQDIAHRLSAYGNDPYKAIVAHYLPALANEPEKWVHPFRVGGRTVQPALSYLKYVVKGSPLEAGLADYLSHGKQPDFAATN
jgi:hypothetical protein